MDNKKVIILSVFLVFGLSFFSIISFDKSDKFSCDNLGIIYAKLSEKESMEGFKDIGAIIMYPEIGIYSARTEVLDCPNIDNYLENLK